VQQQDGGSSELAGEWLELRVRPGAFATRFVLAVADPNYVPDDFVLLAAADDASPWRIARAATAQGAPLVAAAAAGLQYDLDAATSVERVGRFRLVVTRIRVDAAYQAFATLAQVDTFKLFGSVRFPVPDTLLSVDGTTLVVDRMGHVGIGRAHPTAPLHLGGLAQRAASAPSAAAPVPAVVLLDGPAGALGFRGFGLSADALVHVAEAGAAHAFVVGDAELARLGAADGLALSTRMRVGGDLDVEGDLAVRGRMTVDRISYMQSNVTVFSSQRITSNLTVDGGLDVTSGAALLGPLLVGSNADAGQQQQHAAFHIPVDLNAPLTLADCTTAYGPVKLCGTSLLVTTPDGAQQSAYPLTVDAVSAGTTPDGEPTLVSIYTRGALYAGGDVYAFSDARLKRDVRPIDDALDKVRRIGGYTFVKRGQASRQMGVLAQEVELVAPEVVRMDEAGVRHVAYGNLVALLVQAIHELHASQLTLVGRTSTPFEPFDLPLPRRADARRWTAAFVDSCNDRSSAVTAEVAQHDDGHDSVVGQGGATPRAFRVLVVHT
jgi:hypothetical protein